MQVVKRSGEREGFDRNKTKAAIMRVGLTDNEAEDVLAKLVPQLYEGITTEEIYRRVHQLLQGRKAVKFGLKKAILRLGPEGENFEKYVARLYRAEGYQTQNRLMLGGKCVVHEVDVLMTKDGERSMVECKFHNSLGLKCNIQCALYSQARFLDLSQSNRLDHVHLVTNTRFTSDVVRYAECVGMRLLGWRYPEGEGLEELAERHHLYPVTMLKMARSVQVQLLSEDVVLVDDILQQGDRLRRIVPKDALIDLEEQARDLLGP